MVLTRTHGIYKDLWYRLKLIVLTNTHGRESVILNHIRTKGPSVTRMRDFFLVNGCIMSTCGVISGRVCPAACAAGSFHFRQVPVMPDSVPG